MTKSVNARELILGILMDVTRDGEYSHIAIRNVLSKYQYLEKKERAFITRIAEGTIEQMILIDYIINQFSTVKVNKMKPVIRNILRSAVYQLKFMDSIPASAVCDEAVKLAKAKGFANLRGFVNGVLRNISRNLETICYPNEDGDEIQYLSINYSMPEWIVRQWYFAYGFIETKTMLESFLADRKTSIRCNLNKISVEELIRKLESENVRAEKSEYLDYALEISGYDYLNAIPSFREGLFQVQDVSSMLVAEIAAPEKGNYVIDVCAAPGGKSLHIADKLAGTGHVEARDLTEYKVGMIRENIERTGAANIEAKAMDALVFDAASVEKADVLIADLPCSGLGVIGRKTDIKYKMTPEKQQELAKLQREILGTVHSYVKKGGTLIYSTCTINPAENIENIRWFTKEYPFTLESLDPYICSRLQSEETEKGYLQMIPGLHHGDGFFIARLKRNDE